jgi:hypothetical protein
MINSYEIILENYKNHCEIQVRTVLVCALYSIRYGKHSVTFSKYYWQICQPLLEGLHLSWLLGMSHKKQNLTTKGFRA